MKVLAITSCPNGIAHTYMAAENLQKAADKMGVQMKVETQGGVGAENVLTEKEIREADGIIIAADRNIDKSRFVGKKLLVTGVQDGIHKPEQLISNVTSASIYQGGEGEEEQSSSGKQQNSFYRHLMNGVSRMVPAIVVGGLLIAMALTLGGEPTPGGLVIPEDSIWKQIEAIGAVSFMFMVPLLAGFIATSIADRPGLIPGLIGGYIAADGSFYNSEAGAGFIGGIIAGFIAGYAALFIKKIKVPKAIQPIMPIIIIPILASLIVSLAFILLIGAPIAGIFTVLTNWLAGMQGASSIVLALILGAMIASDMGGPINKVAFMFGSAMIAEGTTTIMGPIAVAIATPPIGMGIATFLNKRKYSKSEVEAGKASFAMGLFGITEGAIPFAAQDPLRVIPANIIGAMVGAVIAMIMGVGNSVAHGGPIVGVLGAVDGVIYFFIAIAVGSVVTALIANALKKDINDVPTKEVVTETKVEKEVEGLVSMTQPSLVTTQLAGATQEAIIDEMISMLDYADAITSKSEFKKAILSREAEGSTGIGMGIAIPHGKSNAVVAPTVVFGIKRDGVDWNSIDGTDAKLIFMIAVPESHAGDTHLKILQMLSRKLMDDNFREQLMNAKTKEEAYDLLGTIG